MKKITTLFCLGTLLLLSSCAVHKQKLKADVIGFNDNITTSYKYTNKCLIKNMRKQSVPYDLLSSKGKQEMERFVYGLAQGQNTSAYYALDNALDRVKYVQKKFMEKDPNSQYYVVMLTDGLDNNSMALYNRNKGFFAKGYDSPTEYANTVNKRMNTIMRNYCFFDLFSSTNNDNQFQSFVLLYKGKNSDNYSKEEYEQILKPYNGAQNAELPTPIVEDNFEDLLKEFEKKLIQRTFSFDIPNGYIGKKVRMVLDATKNMYFEGEFVKEGNEFWLNNIVCNGGLTMEYRNIYGGKSSSNSNSIGFIVHDLKVDGYPYKVKNIQTTQWFYDMGKFRQNSEYRSTTNSRKNAYILIILDSSLSFGDRFKEAQATILEIVNMISEL